MLFEFVTTATMAGAWAVGTYYRKNNVKDDAEKIERIAENVGLIVKENGEKRKIRIHRKTPIYRQGSGERVGTEYVFQIPLGLSVKDFTDHLDAFRDGLNNKAARRYRLNVAALKSALAKRSPTELVDAIRSIIDVERIPLNKSVHIAYDGMLKMRVYDNDLPERVLYDNRLLEQVTGWRVPVGYTYDRIIMHDFDTFPMLTVAGMTRYGKTVFLKNVITTLMHNQPDNVTFSLIDLKGGLAFSRFLDCQQVTAVATNERETVSLLLYIQDNLRRFSQDLLRNNAEDITEAGDKRRHFIVIDEGAELFAFADKRNRQAVIDAVSTIARLGAGLGYRLIYATQYPTADVFPRQVKANMSAAVCFRLKNEIQSMVVLDEKGAEQLPAGVRGRALYQTDTTILVQTPFIENPFIDRIIAKHKKGAGNGVGNRFTLPSQAPTAAEARGKYITEFEEV